MTGAQPGGSLMTCGQLTLSQLIRLLFSPRLLFVPLFLFGSSCLPASSFSRLPVPGPLRPTHPPALHPPSPPPRRLWPAPPISAAPRLIRWRQQSRRELVFEGCLRVGLRERTTDRSSLDRSEARCCFCVVCVQFVFLCLCASSPRCCHLRSALPGGPTGASPASRGGPDSPGIWRTGPVGPPGESGSHISASSPADYTFFFFLPLSLLVVWCCFVSGDLFRARCTFLLLSLSFQLPSRRSSYCSNPSHFPSRSHSRPIFTLPFALVFALHFGFFSLPWLVQPVIFPVVALVCLEGRSGRGI